MTSSAEIYILSCERPECLALSLASVCGFNSINAIGNTHDIPEAKIERMRVTVIDDGSTDPITKALLETYRQAGLIVVTGPKTRRGIGVTRRMMIDLFLGGSATYLVQTEGDMLLAPGAVATLLEAWTRLTAGGYKPAWLNTHNHDWCHKITERRAVGAYEIGLSRSNSEPFWMTSREVLQESGALITEQRPDLVPFLQHVGATTLLRPQIQVQHLGVFDSICYPISQFNWATWRKVSYRNGGDAVELRQPLPWFTVDFATLERGDWRAEYRRWYEMLASHADLPAYPKVTTVVPVSAAAEAVAGTATDLPGKAPSVASVPRGLVCGIPATGGNLTASSGMSVATGALAEALTSYGRGRFVAQGQPHDMTWHWSLTRDLLRDIDAGRAIAIGPQVTPQHCRRIPYNADEGRVLDYGNILACFAFSRWLNDLLIRKMRAHRHVLLDFPLPAEWERWPHTAGADSDPKDCDRDALIYIKGGATEAKIAHEIGSRFESHIKITYGQYERADLLAAARRCKACFYISSHDGFSLAAVEIGLMGCPIISDERACPAVAHGLTGYLAPVRERDSDSEFLWAVDASERLCEQWSAAAAIHRPFIRQAILQRHDPQRAVERIIKALFV
jgi:hypothetical protein